MATMPIDKADKANEARRNVYHTLHFRSLHDPYSSMPSVDETMSVYSTLCTNDVQSMLSGGLERFYAKYQQLAKCGNIQLLTPEIRFQDLSYSVECDVRSGEDTVGSYFESMLNPLRRKTTVEKTILHPMSGIIRPGTMTLVRSTRFLILLS